MLLLLINALCIPQRRAAVKRCALGLSTPLRLFFKEGNPYNCTIYSARPQMQARKTAAPKPQGAFPGEEGR